MAYLPSNGNYRKEFTLALFMVRQTAIGPLFSFPHQSCLHRILVHIFHCICIVPIISNKAVEIIRILEMATSFQNPVSLLSRE